VRSLPGVSLRDRVERAQRQLVEGGATRSSRPPDGAPVEGWSFEALPLILTSPEWEAIEAGLIQRARLLDAVIGDVYGAQRLPRERLLPAALVHANAQFLRPCRAPGSPPPARNLVFYAADLVRTPDGSWTVLADHAQAPAGAGYALHLRRTLARTLPEAFRAMPVREIGPFFEACQATLNGMAAAGRDNPIVALLTAGPYSRTYFEQVFLARALGVALVEGGDLTVRGDGVAMKTLDGLKPVDVLLRRLDSAYCDPLELRADSTLGVGGLLEAARAGKVALANAVGSGVVDTPALSPFLPALARHLLGEELRLPAVDVWWLGERAALDYVLAHLDAMTVRPALDADREPVVARDLDPAARATLVERMIARPHAYVAQRAVEPSFAPALAPEGLRPDPVVLRVFLVAHGDGYIAMPGGLARSPPGSALAALGRVDGRVRDVWVLADDSAEIVVPPTARFQRLAIQRGGDLQSRAADNLFWLGRYVERVDNLARLARATLGRLALGPMGVRDLIELRLLGLALGDAGLVERRDAMAPPDSNALAQAIMRCGADGRPLASALTSVRQLAGTLRDRLSADMGSAIDVTLGAVAARFARPRADVDQLMAACDDAIRFAATFSGLAQENMTRGSGWRMLDLGRRLERGRYVCRAALSPFAQTPILWEPAMRLALELCDSTITYRGRYLATLEPAPTLDLVLLDESNPRALAFQIHAISRHLADLGRATGARVAFAGEDLLTDCRDSVAMFQTDERAWRHEGLALAALRDAVERAGAALSSLSEDVTRTYFSLVPAARTVGSMR
ncbi:MAG: circularly permuted type 2 ATP-grasp protein, partial [Rhodospirillales bacterium]|nr:circularly permuted type 2 ATP-grasp protein [Rhodospirillales bacterium]